MFESFNKSHLLDHFVISNQKQEDSKDISDHNQVKLDEWDYTKSSKINLLLKIFTISLINLTLKSQTKTLKSTWAQTVCSKRSGSASQIPPAPSAGSLTNVHFYLFPLFIEFSYSGHPKWVQRYQPI